MSPEGSAFPGASRRSRWTAARAVWRAELRARRRARGAERLLRLTLTWVAAAIAALGCLLRTALPSEAERQAARFGSAELRLDGLSREQAQRLLAGREQALIGEWFWSGPLCLSRGGRALAVQGIVPPRGPLGAGLLRRDGPCEPLSADRVRLSPALSLGIPPEREPLSIGRFASEFRAVEGTLRWPEDLAHPLVELAPEVLSEDARGTLLVARRAGGPCVAPDGMPPLARVWVDAQRRGYEAELRPRSTAPDRFEELAVLVLGGFVLGLAALLITAALTVSIARRRRELGLLRACGAGGGLLLSALVLATGVEALLAGALGSALGAGVAFSLTPWLDGWNNRWNGPFEPSTAHLLGAPALCVLCAILAVWWPARAALRRAPLESLGARRPDRPTTRRTALAASVCLGLCAVATAVGRGVAPDDAALPLLVAALLGLVGLCLVAPSLLALVGRLARRAPLPLRLACRDASRFRTRDGAVVAAILCSSAAAVTVLHLQRSVVAALARGAQGPTAMDEPWLLSRAVLVVAWAAGAGIAAVAGALSLEETRHDRRILEALGAPPRTLRAVRATRLGALAGFGTLLAWPAGLLPLLGILPLAHIPLELRVPWGPLVALLLGSPLLVFAGAYALGKSLPLHELAPPARRTSGS